MKSLYCFVLLIVSSSIFASEESGSISSECLHSIRNLYKFYYYEISPNPKFESCNALGALDDNSSEEMQNVIKQVKAQCPAYLISKVNQSLKGPQPQEL